MDVMDICDKLLYDKEKFIIYLDYRNKLDNDIYLSFEEFLLCENNLEEYINGDINIMDKYIKYHNNEEIKDYECFEKFCKSFSIFPYDKEKLEKYKDCQNCIYYGHTVNLITDEEYDGCMLDDIYNYFNNCEYHIFDVNKVKPIIRSLSR